MANDMDRCDRCRRMVLKKNLTEHDAMIRFGPDNTIYKPPIPVKAKICNHCLNAATKEDKQFSIGIAPSDK